MKTPIPAHNLLRVVVGRLLLNGAIDSAERAALAQALAEACAEADVEPGQCTAVTHGYYPVDAYAKLLAKARAVRS